MYITHIVIVRLNFTHLHVLQLLVLLPFHKNRFFVCNNRINLLNLRLSSDRLGIVAKRFLKQQKQKTPSFP